MLREDREKALAKRAVSNMEKLNRNCRILPKLAVGDSVLVQNQVGNHPSKWDITGIVVEVKEHDQYIVKVDGSGRMTLRNRKFLKKITPYSMTKHFKTSDSDLSPQEASQPSPVPAAQPPLTPRLDPEAAPAEPAQSPGARGHLGPNPEVPCPPSPGPQAEEQIPSPEPAPQAPAPPMPPPATAAPRRSSRASKAPDKLELSWGTKSYAQAVTNTDPASISIRDSFHHIDPCRGEGLH